MRHIVGPAKTWRVQVHLLPINGMPSDIPFVILSGIVRQDCIRSYHVRLFSKAKTKETYANRSRPINVTKNHSSRWLQWISRLRRELFSLSEEQFSCRDIFAAWRTHQCVLQNEPNKCVLSRIGLRYVAVIADWLPCYGSFAAARVAGPWLTRSNLRGAERNEKRPDGQTT